MKKVLEYISRGKAGCTFAAIAARNPDKYDWGFYEIKSQEDSIPEFEHSTVSLLFPEHWQYKDVFKWAISNGMWEEEVKKGTLWRRFKRWWKGEKLSGLRYKSKDNYTAYVMYMGLDSHCPTRQTPRPLLTFRTCSTTEMFYRVGFSGVLHIAQMPVLVALNKAENLWKSSHRNSKRIVGENLNEEHAAKTTYKWR